MFSLRRHLTRVATLGLLLSTAFGDVVVLKSGEKVEGKITKESEEQITLEVKVSASITDERVIPRAEIDRIDKVSPETEIYKALLPIQVATNSVPVAQYDASIRTLEAYIKQFPDSTHTKEVRDRLNEFLAEKKRVEGGEVKLRGVWLSKAEVEREKVQIGGMLALEQMKNQSGAGDSIGALNTFSAVEKIYGGSASMPEMIELAKQLVAGIKSAVERALLEQKVLQARKEQGFKDSGAADKTAMEAAYKADMAQAEAIANAADKAGQWPPFIATYEKPLSILLAKAGRESSRLAPLPTDKMRQSVQLTQAAKRSFDSGDLDGAANTLKQATTLWSANELAMRLTRDVTAAQKTDATNKAATPAPATPKPTPATPRPSAALKAAATPIPAPAEDAAPFYMTLPGAIGIVVTIAAALVGVNVYKKMKAKNNDTTEVS